MGRRKREYRCLFHQIPYYGSQRKRVYRPRACYTGKVKRRRKRETASFFYALIFFTMEQFYVNRCTENHLELLIPNPCRFRSFFAAWKLNFCNARSFGDIFLPQEKQECTKGLTTYTGVTSGLLNCNLKILPEFPNLWNG